MRNWFRRSASFLDHQTSFPNGSRALLPPPPLLTTFPKCASRGKPSNGFPIHSSLSSATRRRPLCLPMRFSPSLASSLSPFPSRRCFLFTTGRLIPFLLSHRSIYNRWSRLDLEYPFTRANHISPHVIFFNPVSHHCHLTAHVSRPPQPQSPCVMPHHHSFTQSAF